MRSYITGSTGFVGSHIKERVKDLTPIPHPLIQRVNIEPFSRFFFCSAYGNMAFHTDEKEIIKANVSDLVSVLGKIDFKNRFASFVYISTSSVKRPHQTTYSRSKKAAEEILLSYMEKYQAPILIVRPYSITGVGEQKEHLIPTLIRSCMTGEKVPFAPSPRHDFIDVEDLVDGILSLSNAGIKGIFEFGTGTSYSNKEVLEIVERVTGEKANVHMVESLRDYDTKGDDWVSTNFKARGYGWLPKKSLELSIRQMYDRAKQENS